MHKYDVAVEPLSTEMVMFEYPSFETTLGEMDEIEMLSCTMMLVGQLTKSLPLRDTAISINPGSSVAITEGSGHNILLFDINIAEVTSKFPNLQTLDEYS
jgi:hypothetical protein